jgi:hypothetical protein
MRLQVNSAYRRKQISPNCLLYMPALLNIRKSTFVFPAAVLVRYSVLGYNRRVNW